MFPRAPHLNSDSVCPNCSLAQVMATGHHLLSGPLLHRGSKSL